MKNTTERNGKTEIIQKTERKKERKKEKLGKEIGKSKVQIK